MKIFNAIWTYLKDWKNLLAHSLVGVAILLVAFIIPVEPIYRILILVIVVALNLIRMKYSKKHQSVKE
ncbi:MAG: hypothetical protein JEZ00_21040 [Anaerolineaceae bacterium]|nr:hypothetical protein [Anaerolineaceae bacterium]